jgi:predicted Zn-dependent protease
VKAIEAAEKQRAEEPSKPALVAHLGDYYAALGNRAKAVPLIRNALALAPEDPDVLVNASQAYEALGMRAQSLPLLMEALSRGYSAEMVKRIPELARLITDKKFRWPEPSDKGRASSGRQ